MSREVELAVIRKRRADELTRWLAEEAWLTADQIAEHVGCSRRTIERLPFEVLPYLDITPGSQRSMRRYAPEDLKVLPARLREWRRAKAQDVEREWLDGQAARIHERDKSRIREMLDANDTPSQNRTA